MQTPTFPYSIVHSWVNSSEWNLANYLTFFAIILTIFIYLSSIFVGFVKSWWRKREQKILEKNVDSGSYPAQVIDDATRYYIRPLCTSVDPTQEVEIRNVVATSEDLLTFVDEFLESNSRRMHIGGRAIRHLIVLADTGMGKTSFVLNYFVHNRKRGLRKRKRLAIVHLGTPHALEKIKAIPRKSDTDLILDALDEDTKAVGTTDAYRTRLDDIFQECSTFKHVIITCRTQFFPRNDEIPKSTGIIDPGVRPAGRSAHFQLWKIYLYPLTDNQVKKYLRKRYPGVFNIGKRRRALKTVLKIPLLTVRPMLLAFIPDLLKDIKPINHIYQLYGVMVESWLERERGWIGDIKKLGEFSKEMAVDIYTRKSERGSETIPRKELLQIAQINQIGIEDWKLTGRSLLNRDTDGNIKFAHRSIMEFLFIKSYLAGDVRCRKIAWTDFMKEIFLEQLKIERVEREVDISEYYVVMIKGSLQGADLSNQDLDTYIRKRCKIPDNQSLRLIFSRKISFANVNFSQSVLPTVDLSNQVLREIDFSHCLIQNMYFNKAHITKLNLTKSRISLLDFSYATLNEVCIDNVEIAELRALNTDLSKNQASAKGFLTQANINSETIVPPHFEKLKAARLKFLKDIKDKNLTKSNEELVDPEHVKWSDLADPDNLSF